MNITAAISADMQAAINSALSGSIGSVLAVVISVFVARKKNSGIKKELEATKTEIKKLKSRLAEFTINPLTLKNGIYYDADGNTYCPACYGSPYERIPLKTHIQRSSWTQYQCPKCGVKYNEGSPPSPPHENWDPLA
jgi:hypothetical protein